MTTILIAAGLLLAGLGAAYGKLLRRRVPVPVRTTHAPRRPARLPRH